MDPLKPHSRPKGVLPTGNLTAGTTTVTRAEEPAPSPETVTRETTNTLADTSTFSTPTAPTRVVLNPPPPPSRNTGGVRSGPVTDPTIGAPDRSRRATGGAGARSYGPLHGPALPWTEGQREAVAAARRGELGALARQVAQTHLADDYPGGIERYVLPDLLRGAAAWPRADAEVALRKVLRHPDAAQSLVQIFNSTGYKALDPVGRQQVRTVLAAAGYEGTRQLADILFKDPSRLADPVPAPHTGSPPRTVLSELARLATVPLTGPMTRARVTTAAALDSLLCDVANPRDIYQGASGTCTVASMQYDLASRNPAEYARIVVDLVTSGQSTLRGDGDRDGKKDVLYAQTEYLVPRREGDGRRLTENWFQSAAMELANGQLEYDAQTDLNLAGRESYRGLYGMQQRVMLEALYGVGYRTVEGDAAALLGAVRAHGEGGKESHPLLLNLRFDGAPGGEGTSHAVTFSHLERAGGTEQVHFRDPWGHGQPIAPAQWNRETGTYSMPVSLFAERAERVHLADAGTEGRPLASRFLPLDPLDRRFL
jgi:hypothetical protein